MSRVRLLLAPLLLLPLSGCPRKGPEKATAPSGQSPTTAPAAAAQPAGVTDPFPRLSSALAKALDRGYKALRQKKYDEAAAAFEEVVAGAPDGTGTRFQLARALLLQGKLPEARQQLEEILARDFVAYAGRVDKPKEWKPLRDSPEWATYQAAEARLKASYGKDLDKGFVFVARTRAAKPADPEGGRLDLNQEVFHYDPQTARYRRLTSTDGHVYAAMRAPDGKTLAFLVVDRLKKGDAGQAFVEPQAGFLDLGSLETVGPFKMTGSFHEVSISFTGGSTPAWSTESTPGVDGGSFVIDTARTGMAKSTVAVDGERTWAQAAQVWHSGKGSPAGVTVAADRRGFTVAAGGQVTSAREIAQTSLEWSPGKQRVTYAGLLDACKVLSEGEKAGKNELFVYDVQKKSAQRIDAGISEFETLWLDDNLLVYENGIGAKGTVNLYDLNAHKKTPLLSRHGAGLYGVPSLSCEKEAAPDEAEANTDCKDCGGE